ncbi:rRNA cytosine-C5-methyltransferase [uncultured Phocaeicola sp.]|uniref:methyltransferase RsmF C-terminal domain-like protein n=1 Tax=uncultured Phocaeicola sp. TaxID=990718 RepID=UPI0025E2BAAF|nr:rRNA cytosine-C5-methyltransferase [uncultured Phocaeicola sp.]
MNLPVDFINRTSELLGEELFAVLREALSKDAPVSVRVNRLKTDAVPDGERRVPWCDTGYYLTSRPTFTFDPLFHAGCYYVQEASSMFLEQVLKQYVHEPVVMLDLCAAPGGKSTLARSVLPEGSLLVANEVMRGRVQVLAENVTKWGHPDMVVLNNDPADFTSLGELFDVILTDVPCSGEGMFRKDPVAVEEWSKENVTLCWQRQRRIVRDIWDCLKPGGLLIYSTCTYNREENEDNVAWIADELGAEILPVAVPSEWNITGNLAGKDFPVYRFLPHRTEGEGLFMAVLRKSGESEVTNVPACRGRKEKKSKGGKEKVPALPKEVKGWFVSPGQYVWTMEQNQVTAFPTMFQSVYETFREQMRVVCAGIQVAEIKGRDLIPSHALAMSVCRNESAFPSVEVSYEQAITYLRKESFALEADTPRGYVLIRYKGVPLGFVKNIGNRANNLYPQEWRIRSGYLPEQVSLVLGNS